MFQLARASLFLVLVVCFSRVSAFTTNLTGQASVVDGDTLEIHGTRIRLWGIDAPESSQLCRGDDSLPYRCGAKAANELDAFIAGRSVSCEPVSRDVYGRTVATCSVGGINMGDWLVRGGLAFDWPRSSKGKYDSAQREPCPKSSISKGRRTNSPTTSRRPKSSARLQVFRRSRPPLSPRQRLPSP